MNDLREMFPDLKWQWTADHGKGMRFDPFHVELVGKYGTVYLHRIDGSVLQAHVTGRLISKRATRLGCVRIHQVGLDEATVIFNLVDAESVFTLMKMKKKRVMSEIQMANAKKLGMLKRGPNASWAAPA